MSLVGVWREEWEMGSEVKEIASTHPGVGCVMWRTTMDSRTEVGLSKEGSKISPRFLLLPRVI